MDSHMEKARRRRPTGDREEGRKSDTAARKQTVKQIYRDTHTAK